MYMQNILSVYNEQTKEILKVRVNPVMTIGGLKLIIAQKYKTGSQNVVVYFNGMVYDSKPVRRSRTSTPTRHRR